MHRCVLMLMLTTSLLASSPAFAATPSKDKNKLPGVRWIEGNPGCTFTRGEDGKYRYGMWNDDVGVVLAVDSQELEKVHRRRELFFAVFLTVRYRGQSSLEFTADQISLQFMKHFQVIQTALDPRIQRA